MSLSSKRPMSELPEPLNLKDRPTEKRRSQFQHTRTASQKTSRDSLVSSNTSPRTSAQSFDSRSSTPTRWSDEIPKKRTKKIMEKRKVKTIKTHPPLKFQEDVMLFLQNSETSPTFVKLVDAISVSINSIPSTPFTPSFPSPSTTAYPSPPISPTTPTIIVEQANESRVSLSSVTSAPRLSLFPRPKTRDSDTKEFDVYSELLKTRSDPPTKELPPIPATRLITPVKKINIGDSPLGVQNEIRGILGDRMTAVRKFPTVVQGLALGMGLGLGLLNGGGESLGNKFWSPVLGGSGVGASVDMIFAVGFERGCEKWGNKLIQKITSGIGRCGPAHCVSLSYLLSLSLRQLNPSSPNYTSQVHAALSGKHLVPQLEDYLSVNSTTRCLVITFDAATIPNANLEPIRELKRVLDGSSPESVLKIISIIGGNVNGETEKPTSPTTKEISSKNFSKPSQGQTSPKASTYRTTPMPMRSPPKNIPQSRPNGSPNTSPTKKSTGPRKSKSSASLKTDEKTLMRRRELEALSNILIVQKPDDNNAFDAHVSYISSLLKEHEEKTGSYKAFENTFEEEQVESSADESSSSAEDNSLPDEEDEDDFEVSYNDAVMSVGSLPRQHKSHASTWSKMWSREILGKKRSKANGPNNCGIQEQGGSAKAFKLLGLDS
ncbi:hypothetical protein ABW19_dt0202615 [Dactylella cylindrospora]|nr:hypothetical protein ABW19_dt0202615 [Dactylella cylindrospora]